MELGDLGVASVAGGDDLAGSPVAITSATQKMAAEYSSVDVVPMVFCNATAGSTAAKPTMPEMRPSFEFASTSSSSVRTTLGTSALFEIA